MGLTKRIWQSTAEEAEWHFKHCTIGQEDDRDSGTTAWCEEHRIDVTDCLPDYEPDYDDRDEDE